MAVEFDFALQKLSLIIACCCTPGPLDCIETITISKDLHPVFSPPGTVCFRCDFGSRVATDVQFSIDTTAALDDVLKTESGVLVVSDSERVFSKLTPRTMRCGDMNNNAVITTTVFLRGMFNFYTVEIMFSANLLFKFLQSS